MPKPLTDAKLRQSIYENLPLAVKKLRLENADLIEEFKKIIAPVLEFYGREKVYDVILFRHPTPVMFSDSGVLVVLSTGLIERAESDDEILGYVAHEVGHEYFAQYSIYSKYLLKLIEENGREPALKDKLAEILALIELECDAFSALTLAHLGYNPFAFIEGMERTGRDFPNHSIGFHPPDFIRRRLVEKVVPDKYLQTKSKTSITLQNLKNSLGSTDKQKSTLRN